MAIWVPSVANQAKETDASDKRTLARGYSSLSPVEDKNEVLWRRTDGADELELSVVENAADSEAAEEMLLEELKVFPDMLHHFVPD